MAKHLLLIRHVTSVADTYVGKDGEVTIDLSKHEFRVHDGKTPGGFSHALADLSNVPAATASSDGKLTAAVFQQIQNALTKTGSSATDFTIESTSNPFLRIKKTNNTTDGKTYFLEQTSTELALRALSDSEANIVDIIRITRSGLTISKLELIADAIDLLGTISLPATTTIGGANPLLDSNLLLKSLGAAVTAADNYFYTTAQNIVTVGTITAKGRNILSAANNSAVLTEIGAEPAFTKNSAFNKNFDSDGISTLVSRSDHSHTAFEVGAEPAFTHNNAFNRSFTASGGNNGVAVTVARGDHTHTAAAVGAEPAFAKNSAFNKNFGSAAGTVSEGNHTHAASAITGTNSGYNLSLGTTAGTVSEGNHTHFATNTVMVFYQSTVPNGWQRLTTVNDAALRVVSTGGGVVGGTDNFSAFPNLDHNHTSPAHDHTISHTHDYTDVISHTHPDTITDGAGAHTHTITGSTKNPASIAGNVAGVGDNGGGWAGGAFADNIVSLSAGGHNHSITPAVPSGSVSTGTTAGASAANSGTKAATVDTKVMPTWDPKYADVMLAKKL